MSFTNAEDLKNHIDIILAPHLGTWGDGTPRSWISPPSVEPSNQASLQVVIYRNQTGEVYGAGDLSLQDRIYELVLVNYADDAKMTDAIETLESDLKIIQKKVKQYSPRSSETYETCRFFIHAPRAVNRT
ncbi:MAG: hypothetical protein F6K11_18110 [Leptolyngbya sp. SIO3F4]|nr:hypothetical protein [Leptolyngbya sp. SIO3F4]